MPWGNDPIGNPSDAIRALVGDTDAAKPKLTDETYLLIIANETRIYARASMAARALAGKYATEMTKRVGDLWREAKVLFQHYSDLAKDYRHESSRRAIAKPFLGGNDVIDVETRRQDTGVVQPEFEIGMMDATPVDPSHPNPLCR